MYARIETYIYTNVYNKRAESTSSTTIYTALAFAINVCTALVSAHASLNYVINIDNTAVESVPTRIYSTRA